MGAGRKMQTLTLSEKTQQRFTVNCRPTARNLKKSDLAGVIFGCRHITFRECFSKKLFGLPAPHYSYVKNIEPGLPLFLFNYSDRKLHGIFEAASSGKLDLNSRAWTTDGSETTPYPAQVKFQIRMQCEPLLEDQFQHIIAENYYEPMLFWFELDQAQTKKLVSMFSSSPIITSTSLSKRTAKMGAQLKELRAPKTKQECDTGERSAVKLGISNMNAANMGGSTLDPTVKRSYSSAVRNVNNLDAHTTYSNVGWFTWEDSGTREGQLIPSSIDNQVASNNKQNTVDQKLNCNTSYSCVMRCPQKKWSALFKEETCSDVIKEAEVFNPPASEVSHAHLDLFTGDWESLCLPDSLDESSVVAKAALDLEDFGEYGEVVSLKTNRETFRSSLVTEPSSSNLQSCSFEILPIAVVGEESKYFQLEASEGNLPLSDKFQKEWSSSCGSLGVEEERHNLEVPGEENPLELSGNDILDKPSLDCSSFPFVSGDVVSTNYQLQDAIQSTNLSFLEVALASEINSSSIHPTEAKLLFEVGELKLSLFKEVQKVKYLEKKLVESSLEIQQLKERCRMLETRSVVRCDEADDFKEEQFQSVDGQPGPAFDGSICIVGGFNGCSWLSALDIYSSSQDLMRTWTSMSFVRSYASAAKFCGEFYILGGVDGNLCVCLSKVESYNPVSDQWTSHPPLKQKKGSFSVLPLDDTMFFFGGGNGVECVSEVEMFDPNIGRWISLQSLLHKRFAPAAAEIHGALYVSGGYDGNDYLKTIERLDPREHSWEKLENMATKRGCHSLVAHNEKLYAIGGFDGTRMVSTVEIFDPRAGSWMMEESMKNSRGNFGTIVIRDKIHVIGGLQGDEVLDEVESYKEGQGWQVNNWKAIGKRCFFHAVLL
ncbi:hypothetical protein PTKIN_Ptkin03bG0106200 [Pterospermum kingtungense]